MLKVAVGHSCDPDSKAAVQEVIAICLQGLIGNTPKAGILIAAPDYEHSILLEVLYDTWPDLELIGGTSNSEISSQEGFQQDSLVLVLFSSDTIQIRAGVGYQVQQNPKSAVQTAVQEASKKLTQPTKLCLALPDGLRANGSSVVENLRMLLPSHAPIVGGSTSEHFKYESTYQFFKTDVLTNTVPILLFAGDLKLSIGVSTGWRTIGSKGIVNRASGNVVHEIDHRPARQFYSKYFGTLTLEPADNGLAVFESHEGNFYLRALQQQYDAQATELAFLGNIPQQSIVQLTEANRADIFQGAQTSISNALANYPGTQPEVLLCLSCAARRMLLGKEATKEYAMIKATLPTALPVAGFYCYGEIAPFEEAGKSHFHNFTLVSLLLGAQ